jgi:Leu/Phe-tRNA-protein transferase
MYLKYTLSGHLYISPDDDCQKTVDAMIATDYGEEFCLAVDFSPEFVKRLMKAGFLVMSANLTEEKDEEPAYILLPKLHLVRSVLFFENLHIKKSIRRFLDRYELRPDAEFDRIIERCVEIHGDDWLTPPLVDCVKRIRKSHPLTEAENRRLLPTPDPRPVSFALYREGKLTAGEFGVVCGNVYTSYSGFYDEDNAGTVQIILAARHLQEQGFSFLDFGMPLDYKIDLGAVDIQPGEFIALFRSTETARHDGRPRSELLDGELSLF